MSDAQETAEQVRDSTAVEGLARLGLASRGLVWVVTAGLTASVAAGGDQRTDQSGALRAISDRPFGGALLVVLVVGFLGYAAWLLLSAAVGHTDAEGRSRWLARGESLAKGLVYCALATSTGLFLLRSSQGGDGQDPDATASRTADLMARPGGRTAVGLVGLVVLGVGLAYAVKGLLRKHSECLEHYRVPSRLRRPAVLVGAVGYVGRGFVLVLVGGFLLSAAVQFDPEQARGLDAALQLLVEQPYGPVLLAVAAVGMLAYALWSWFEAAYREV